MAEKLKKKLGALEKWLKREKKKKQKKIIKLRRGRSGVWVANWNKKKIESMDVMGNESRKARIAMWLRQEEQIDDED